MSFWSHRWRVWPWRGLPPLASTLGSVTLTVNVVPAQIASGPLDEVWGFSWLSPEAIWVLAACGATGQATAVLSPPWGTNSEGVGKLLTSFSVVTLKRS